MKTLKRVLVGFGVVLLLVVVSGYFALNTGPKVQTEWSEADLASGLEKSGVTIADISEIDLETLTRGNFTTSGTNQVDEVFTQEEMSALIASANDAGGPIRDFKVAFNGDGKGEVSFRLSENFTEFLQDWYVVQRPSFINRAYANGSDFAGSSNGGVTQALIDYIVSYVDDRPVYANGELFRDSANSVRIRIDSLRVGRVPMSETVIARVEQEVVAIVNSIIAPENGFHIEEMQVRDGAIYYRGTLPAEVEGTSL